MIKKISKTKTEEFSRDREFSVILERIDSNIKVIMEGQDIMRSDLNATKNMVAKNTEAITMLDMRLSKVEADIKELKSDVHQLKADVAQLKTDVAELRADFNGMKADMKNVDARLTKIENDVAVIKTDFVKRLTHLEATIK